MDIDSVGTFTMCHEALKYLKKGGAGKSSSSGGLILNISATLHYTASWYQIHVSAAKVCNLMLVVRMIVSFYFWWCCFCVQAAVDALTRNLALEWGTDYDIRVNGIAPGPIADTTGLSKLLPDEINNRRREQAPLFRLGDKWDIAMAAVYIASDAGWCSFITPCIVYCLPLLCFCAMFSYQSLKTPASALGWLNLYHFAIPPPVASTSHLILEKLWLFSPCDCSSYSLLDSYCL